MACAERAAGLRVSMWDMAKWQETYSAAQREAVIRLYEQRDSRGKRVRTAGAVSRAAHGGKLSHDGERLAAFEIPETSVRSLARHARRGRAEQLESPLEQVDQRDVGELIRQRLLRGVDAETRRLEKLQKDGKATAGEDWRQLARAARELAALPLPGEARPPVPGREPGGRHNTMTRGGLPRDLLEPRTELGQQLVAAAKDAKQAAEPPPPPEPPEPAPEPVKRPGPQPPDAAAARARPPEPAPNAAMGREVQRRIERRMRALEAQREEEEARAREAYEAAHLVDLHAVTRAVGGGAMSGLD